MPPKETHSCGQFYFRGDDGYELIGRIEEAQLILDNPISEKAVELPNIIPNEEYTFTVKTESLGYLKWAFLLLGKWPTNNWLKMHGLPMVRRCGYHKRKHK